MDEEDENSLYNSDSKYSFLIGDLMKVIEFSGMFHFCHVKPIKVSVFGIEMEGWAYNNFTEPSSLS